VDVADSDGQLFQEESMNTFGHRIGVGIMALLGLINVVGLVGLGRDDAPPAGVLVAGAVLGAITVVAALPAYNRTPGGIWTMIGAQVVSGLIGIPVFWADNAPDWAIPAVVASWVVTLLGIVLLAPALRSQRTEQLV
jgi:hypothetical protein